MSSSQSTSSPVHGSLRLDALGEALPGSPIALNISPHEGVEKSAQVPDEDSLSDWDTWPDLVDKGLIPRNEGLGKRTNTYPSYPMGFEERWNEACKCPAPGFANFKRRVSMNTLSTSWFGSPQEQTSDTSQNSIQPSLQGATVPSTAGPALSMGCLMRLPNELLEIIIGNAIYQDLVNLASICRRKNCETPL